MLNSDKKNKKDYLPFFILLSLLLLDRVIFLCSFNIHYACSDDMIYWLASTDYSHGIFHEPYFYGQNYNFMIESVVAVPFLLLGIPHHIALPVSTTLLYLFPFLLFSLTLFRNGLVIESLFFLFVPLSLPVEYSLLSTGRCGFVGGLFFSGFLVFCIINPHKKISFFLTGFCLAMGYIFLPNSLVFSLPICLYMFFMNYKRFSFYWINVVTIIPILLLEYFAVEFYNVNPDYKVCYMWPLSYNVDVLIDNFKHLDIFFSYLTPVLWSFGWLSVAAFLLAGIFLIKKNWKKGVSLLFGAIFILILLGINKVNDHLPTIFLSSGRMFLGIPLLLALTMCWTRKYFFPDDKKLKSVLLLIGLTIFCVKISLYAPSIKLHTLKTNHGSIALKKVTAIQEDCSWLNEIVKQNNIEIIIFIPYWNLNVPTVEFYNYACPLLEKDFTKTMMTVYEKRTWVFVKEKKSVYSNVLLFGPDMDMRLVESMENIPVSGDSQKLILIKNNKLSMEELMAKLNVKLLRNGY